MFSLIALEKPGTEKSWWVYRFAQTADLSYRFRLREEFDYIGLSVSDTEYTGIESPSIIGGI